MWSLEIVDTRTGNACRTNQGAAFDAGPAWDKALANLKALEVDDGPFLVDIINDGADAGEGIHDTVVIDAAGFKALTGENARGAEVYAAIDSAYWRKAFAAYKSKYGGPR